MSAPVNVTTPEYSMDQLMHKMSREEVLALFSTLRAPGPQELQGEYAGHTFDGGDSELRAKRNAFFFDENSARGAWVGKGYTSNERGEGEGHNIFKRGSGAIVRNYRFRTEIAKSPFDGQPSLMMYYSAFDTDLGDIDLLDEIRRLSHGQYLGIYSATMDIEGFSLLKPGNERSEIDIFGLSGPTGPWVGVDDIHLEVKS